MPLPVEVLSLTKVIELRRQHSLDDFMVSCEYISLPPNVGFNCVRRVLRAESREKIVPVLYATALPRGFNGIVDNTETCQII